MFPSLWLPLYPLLVLVGTARRALESTPAEALVPQVPAQLCLFLAVSHASLWAFVFSSVKWE